MDKTVIALAKKYKKTCAQIVLRWAVQHNLGIFLFISYLLSPICYLFTNLNPKSFYLGRPITRGFEKTTKFSISRFPRRICGN